MKDYIRERVVDIADYLIAHKCTVRAVADVFCVSKSTAHKDLAERLPRVDSERYKLIAAILADNCGSLRRAGKGTQKQKNYRRQSGCVKRKNKIGVNPAKD